MAGTEVGREPASGGIAEEVAAGRAPSTPVGRLARVTFVAGFCLTIGTGVTLWGAPTRTADYWAWTIGAPLTAAFFGAGYLGAAVSLLLAAREAHWRRARIVAVLAFSLTSLALVDTLRALSQFAFRDGGGVAFVAWVWLVVYVALPPLVLAAFVVQERAGGAGEYGREQPALRSTRLVLGAAGAILAAIGVALEADWRWLADRWPWPLPSLPATIVGAWFCTYAVGLLWFALRERDWSRSRMGVVPSIVPLLLQLVAAARLHGGLAGHAATAIYLAGVFVLLVAVGAVSVVEERRMRGSAAAGLPAAAAYGGPTAGRVR
jgi:hypothetical protein